MAKIKLKLKNSKLLLPVGLGLLIVLVLVGSWLIFGKSSDPATNDEGADIVSELQIRAQEASANGDIEEGLRLYDESIEASDDAMTKQDLLVAKAYFAFSSTRNEEAIEIAKSADALGPKPMTILALARLYEANGDNQEAADHYQRLLDTMGADTKGRNSSQDLKSEIERLRSL